MGNVASIHEGKFIERAERPDSVRDDFYWHPDNSKSGLIWTEQIAGGANFSLENPSVSGAKKAASNIAWQLFIQEFLERKINDV